MMLLTIYVLLSDAQWSAMNFTPFTGSFTGTIPVHQFAAKFTNANGQTTTMPPGTVVLSGGDGGIHYLRPSDVVSQAGTLTNQTLITVPVSMEQGSGDGKDDSTVTVQAQGSQSTATVQVHNPLETSYQVKIVQFLHLHFIDSDININLIFYGNCLSSKLGKILLRLM